MALNPRRAGLELRQEAPAPGNGGRGLRYAVTAPPPKVQAPARRRPIVLIASPSADVRRQWRRGLEGAFQIFEGSRYPGLEDDLLRIRPDALLVDAALLPIDGIGTVRRWSLVTKVLLLVDALDEAEAISVLKAGARGYRRKNGSVGLVRQAVKTVQRGGVWVEERVAARLVEEVRSNEHHGRTAHVAASGVLDGLTSREREVARFVADGARNKQIASQLHITEATVKAHLTAVFRKLGLPDRLHLGLRLSQREDERADGPRSR